LQVLAIRICSRRRRGHTIAEVDNEEPAAQKLPAERVIDDVLAVLRQRGGRSTHARRLILEVLLRPGHRRADEIAATVREQAPDVHLTTVYRNLDELERLRIVDRTYISHSPATYHLASAAHGHLACEVCGSIDDLPGEAFATLREIAMAQHGFQIRPGRFAIPGRCARCR
jgi:Fe2+ or Zn2+ uptake regulation protein